MARAKVGQLGIDWESEARERITLRGYQLEAVEEIKAYPFPVIMQAMTGAGKTVVLAEYTRQSLEHGSRVMIVAHRRELIEQMRSTLWRLGVDDVAKVLSGEEENYDALVQIAGVDSLRRRLDKVIPPKIVMIDEAHRATAGTTYSLLFKVWPHAKFIGATATPCRLGGLQLSSLWKKIICLRKPSLLIEDGYIAKPKCFGSLLTPNMVNVKKQAGDFLMPEAAKLLNNDKLNGNIVETWCKHSAGRRGILFACTVGHSLNIRDRLRGAGVKAEHLDGETKYDERDRILRDLRTGDIDVVCNVGVLTEGFDEPSAKICVLARPTASLALHIQMCGRVLRPWGGVEPLVLDHAGNLNRHGFPHQDREWILEERKAPGKKREVLDLDFKLCPRCGYGVEFGIPECPECGYEWPVRKPKSETSEALSEITQQQIAMQNSTDATRKEYYFEQIRFAALKGYKPGMAFHRYLAKYGQKPPWEWNQIGQRMYKSAAFDRARSQIGSIPDSSFHREKKSDA